MSSWIDTVLWRRVWALSLLASGLFSNPAEAERLEPSFTLGLESGLRDQDLEAFLALDDVVLVGSADGIDAYDGFEWRALDVRDTVRWLGRSEQFVWAAGSRGVWRASATDLERFELVPGSPLFGREGLVTSDGDLWIASETGLHYRSGDTWTQRWKGRARSLAFHPERGLLVGTMGEGLLVLGHDESVEQIRAPYPGVRDSLAGNYVHDIVVDGDGTVRMATSWGGLKDRFTAYGNAQRWKRIDERNPHDYLRAAICAWSPQGWDVRYLYQTGFAENARANLEYYELVYYGDLDGDQVDEALFTIPAGRELHPRGLACFDVASGAQKWFHATAGSAFQTVPVRHSDGTTSILLNINGQDHGAVQGLTSDSQAQFEWLTTDGELLRSTQLRPRQNLIYTDVGSQRRGYLREPLYCIKVPYDSPHEFSLWTFPTDGQPARQIRDVGNYIWREGITDSRGRQLAGALVGSRDGSIPPPAYDVLDVATGERVQQFHPDAFGRDSSSDRWSSFSVLVPHEEGFGLLYLHRTGVYLGTPNGVTSHRFVEPYGAEFLWTSLRSPDLLELSFVRHNGKIQILGTRGDSKAAPSTTHPLGNPTRPSLVRYTGPTDPDVIVGDGLEPLCQLPPVPPDMDLAPWVQSFLPRYNTSTEAWEWIGSHPVDGALLRLDEHGTTIARLELPSEFASSERLEWVSHAGVDESRGSLVLILDPARMPLLARRLDLESLHWTTRFEANTGFFDPGCDATIAIECLGENPAWVGLDSGLHEIDTDTRCVGNENDRIRGVDGSSQGVRWWGERGLAQLEPQAVRLDAFGSDVTRFGERTLAAGDVVAFVDPSTDRTRPIVRHVRESGNDEFRILLRTSDHVWVQSGSRRGDGASPPYRIDRAGDRWNAPQGAFNFERGIRWIRSAVPAKGSDWLAAMRFDLLLLNSDGQELARLGRPPSALWNDLPEYTALTPAGDTWVAATEEGPIYRVEVDSGELRASLFDSTRTRQTAVLEFLHLPNGIVARSATTLEFWPTLGDTMRWDVAGLPPILRVMEAGDMGLAWVGTERGLWRLDETFGPCPTSIPGLPLGRVTGGYDWSTTQEDSTVWMCVDGRLWSFETTPRRGEARFRWDSGEIRAALWDEGPRLAGDVLLRQGYGFGLLGTSRIGPQRQGAWPPAHRGRQQLDLYLLDCFGRVVNPPAAASRIVRLGGTASLFASVGIPALLLGVWTFSRRRGLLWDAGWLLAPAIALLVAYRGFYLSIGWWLAGATALVMLLLALAVRMRPGVEALDPQEARERLDAMLKAFRHRGSGLNPVDRLILLARNAEVLHAEGSDFEQEVRLAFDDLLESTRDLEDEGRRLVDHVELDRRLLDRFFVRLGELRSAASRLASDRTARRQWLVDEDERLSFVDLGTAFLQASERTSELFRRHRQVDVEAFLRALAERTEKWHGVRVELDLPEAPIGVLPIAESDLSEVFENLVGNSLRAMEGVAEPRIALAAGLLNGAPFLSIADAGPGMAEEDWVRFQRPGVSGTGGSGFGLGRCVELLRRNGWGLRRLVRSDGRMELRACAGGPVDAAPTPPDSASVSGRKGNLVPVFASALVAIAVVAAALLVRSNSGSSTEGDPYSRRLLRSVGHNFDAPQMWDHMYAEVPLPEDLGPIATILPLPPDSNGRVHLALGPRPLETATVDGWVARYDPASRSELWRQQFAAPAERRRTHETLTPDEATSPAWVSRLGVLPATPTQPERLAVVWQNKFSPSVLEVRDPSNGDVLASYFHPGRLNDAVAADLANDGVLEVFSCGVDNTYACAVVVAVRPDKLYRAASSVMWNETGTEDGLWRILLPNIPGLLEAVEADRIEAQNLAWRPATPETNGRLRVEATADVDAIYYLIVEIPYGEVFPSRWSFNITDRGKKVLDGMGVDVGSVQEGLMDGMRIIVGGGGEAVRLEDWAGQVTGEGRVSW